MPNLSPSDVPKAEAAARAQRHAGCKYLRMSKRKAANPADVALCERVTAAAAHNFIEFEKLLAFPAVNALFSRGALFYRVGR